MTQIINLTIKNSLGLHARPAASIARIAQKAKGEILILKGEESVDASSLIDILSLACGQGSSISLHAKNPEDAPLLYDIAELVKNGFGE